MAGQLRWARADASLLERFWAVPDHMEQHATREQFRLVEPTVAAFIGGIREAIGWLGQYRGHPEWDGGGLALSFAGHGQPGTGALCLTDGDVRAEDLLGELASARADLLGNVGRLRVSLALDSCHAGAFLTRFIARASNDYRDAIYPYISGGACMPDELAYEADVLEHGFFTPSFVNQADLEDLRTTAPEYRIALLGLSGSLAGPAGCVFLSGARQHPIMYWEYGEFECLKRSVVVAEVADPAQLDEALHRIRDEVQDEVRAFMRFVQIDPALESDIERFLEESSGLPR